MGVGSEIGTLARELLWTDAAWCLDVFKSAQATENGVSSSATRDAVIKLGTDLGEDLSAFHLMVGSAHQATATLDLSALQKVSWDDHYVRTFLPRQYETALGDEAKMLVLLLESDLNTLVFLLSQTSSGHEGAFFRTAMVTLWHVLVSLQALLDAHPAALAFRVRELLASEDVTTFLDSRNKRIRNTFVHYIPQNLPLDATRPLWGLVEVLNPDQDIASLSALTWRLAQATRATIEMWRLGD